MLFLFQLRLAPKTTMTTSLSLGSVLDDTTTKDAVCIWRVYVCAYVSVCVSMLLCGCLGPRLRPGRLPSSAVWPRPLCRLPSTFVSSAVDLCVVRRLAVTFESSGRLPSLVSVIRRLAVTFVF